MDYDCSNPDPNPTPTPTPTRNPNPNPNPSQVDYGVGAALGQPASVGELCLRSLVSKDAIAAPTDADGWYRTGDLVEWLPDRLEPARYPTARIKVLERAAFAVKLANGEFVCPSRLEARFAGPTRALSLTLTLL